MYRRANKRYSILFYSIQGYISSDQKTAVHQGFLSSNQKRAVHYQGFLSSRLKRAVYDQGYISSDQKTAVHQGILSSNQKRAVHYQGFLSSRLKRAVYDQGYPIRRQLCIKDFFPPIRRELDNFEDLRTEQYQRSFIQVIKNVSSSANRSSFFQ